MCIFPSSHRGLLAAAGAALWAVAPYSFQQNLPSGPAELSSTIIPSAQPHTVHLFSGHSPLHGYRQLEAGTMLSVTLSVASQGHRELVEE